MSPYQTSRDNITLFPWDKISHKQWVRPPVLFAILPISRTLFKVTESDANEPRVHEHRAKEKLGQWNSFVSNYSFARCRMYRCRWHELRYVGGSSLRLLWRTDLKVERLIYIGEYHRTLSVSQVYREERSSRIAGVTGKHPTDRLHNLCQQFLYPTRRKIVTERRSPNKRGCFCWIKKWFPIWSMPLVGSLPIRSGSGLSTQWRLMSTRGDLLDWDEAWVGDKRDRGFRELSCRIIGRGISANSTCTITTTCEENRPTAKVRITDFHLPGGDGRGVGWVVALLNGSPRGIG